jgi:hypothetical protein
MELVRVDAVPFAGMLAGRQKRRLRRRLLGDQRVVEIEQDVRYLH